MPGTTGLEIRALGLPRSASARRPLAADEPVGSVHWVNFRWLRNLRWVAVVGQTLTVLTVRFLLDVKLELTYLLAVIGFEFLLNGAALYRERRQWELGELELASWVALDLAAFAALLFATGGPENPFSFFFVVHVAMAALTLSPPLAWGLVALSVATYGSLLVWRLPFPVREDAVLLRHGSWTAYALGASCVVYFVLRARAALAKREQLLAEQRELRLQAERLSSLGTLAAGAAHELANPLGTIAVVSKELEHELRTSDNAAALQDMRIVRSQVERCRKILARMAHTAGEAPGEADAWIGLKALLKHTLDDLPAPERVVLSITERAGSCEVRCPREAVAQTLRVLVDNGLDASGPGANVRVSASFDEAELAICVLDEGFGMPPEVLGHAFDPFFTTKPTGKGMGLGLFLARNVAVRLGGTLELRSRAGAGTVAELRIPAARVRSAQDANES